MSALIEVPRLSDLDGLPGETVPAEVPGVVSVTGWANDGSSSSSRGTRRQVLCTCAGRIPRKRLLVEREALSKISVRESHGGIEFRVWVDGGGIGGQLVVRVGDHVDVSDTLLRK